MKFYVLVVIAVLTILGLPAFLLVPLIVDQVYPRDGDMFCDIEHVETLVVPTNDGDIQLDVFYASTWSRTPYRPKLKFHSNLLLKDESGQLSKNPPSENKMLFADVAQQTHSGLFYQQNFYLLLTSDGRYGIASTCPRSLPNETGLDVWCPESFPFNDAGEYKWENISTSPSKLNKDMSGVLAREVFALDPSRFTWVGLGFESLK